MVPALEIMVNTERIREMIEEPTRTREIKDAIAEGLHPYGMVTFDQSLASLVKQKLVTYEEAVKNSTSPSDFALLFRGVSGTSETWDHAGGPQPAPKTQPPAKATISGKATVAGNPTGSQTATSGEAPAAKGNPGEFEIDRFGR